MCENTFVVCMKGSSGSIYRPKQSQRPAECSTHFRKPQETGIHYHQLELFCFVWRVHVFVVLLDLFVCLFVGNKKKSRFESDSW